MEYILNSEGSNVIVLPLNVGDSVWIHREIWESGDVARQYTITNFMISENKKHQRTMKYTAHLYKDGREISVPYYFSPDEIGVTVFRTEAEAIKSLQPECGNE